MASALGHFASKSVLLSSILFLLAHAAYINPTGMDLAKRQADCSTYSCGQACILAFATSNCDAELPPGANVANSSPWGTTVIGDTAEVVTPFQWTANASVNIMSLSYVIPDTKNSTDCPAIHFAFYDALHVEAGFTYMIPGQNYSPCVTFDNSTVVYYNGATMEVPVLEYDLRKGNILAYSDN